MRSRCCGAGEGAHAEDQLREHDLAALGRDLEAVALARAVTAHVEHRVLLNGSKTVVFS
jgi:formyltetrahydrofolate deformylase